MKTIAVGAVTAGGKTTVINELKEYLPNAKTLHFDDYSFEGEVKDFHAWTMQGADYHVWDLTPLIRDICEIRDHSDCDYLLLDYPFAYRHEAVSHYIDCAIFLDTPLDVAMARRILRDKKEATGDEIREEMEIYLKYARVAYIQTQKDILPSSDHVIDGTKEVKEIVEEIAKIILGL